jgi:hypothetical protein
MSYTHAIVFYDNNKSALKIRADQYRNLKTMLKKDHFVEINGEIYNRSDIRRIEKMKVEQLSLPGSKEKPVSQSFLEKFKEEMAKRFSV